MMSLDIDFFMFGVHCVSWICGFVVFLKLGKILAFSHIFSALSTPLGTLVELISSYLQASHSSLMPFAFL